MEPMFVLIMNVHLVDIINGVQEYKKMQGMDNCKMSFLGLDLKFKT